MVPSLLCTFVAHITFLHVFFLPPPFILSLSLLLSLSLSLSFSLSLFISAPLFLSVVARHMSSDALYQIFSSWSILLFHTISFHSSYKIHQLFTDYLLRLPSSELLEKHLFRSRANRRLVYVPISLSIQLSICPSIHLSICLSLHLYIYQSLHLSICLSIHLSLYPPTHLCIYASMHLSTFPPIHLSI